MLLRTFELEKRSVKIHFDCGQTCFEEEELNLRLKGGPVTEKETEVGTTFHFVTFLFARCFKQTLPKTNRSFHYVSSCAEFCCAML